MAPVHVKIIGELISGRLLVTLSLSLSQKHLIPEIKLDFFLVAESKFCRLHNPHTVVITFTRLRLEINKSLLVLAAMEEFKSTDQNPVSILQC